MAKPLISWLMPSFSKHNLCLVVLGHCLHVSVTTFQDKFASLRQVNSPNSWDKFKKCCTDMYFIRFLPNFMVHVFCVFLWISRHSTVLPEFCGSTTAQNIRRPDICTCTDSLVSLQNVWGMSTDIHNNLLNNVSLPWIEHLIGWSKFHMQHDQSEVLSRTAYWHIMAHQQYGISANPHGNCMPVGGGGWGQGHGNTCKSNNCLLQFDGNKQ